MSYTGTGRPALFAMDVYTNELDRGLAVFFQCPRCGSVQARTVSARELGQYGEVSLMCGNANCTKHADRPGYEICLRLTVESRMLGLHDEPLGGAR